MAVLKRVGWFLFFITFGVALAVVCACVCAFGVLLGTHRPYWRDGLTLGVERIEDDGE